jgi:ferredoxin-NADP reductase
MRMRDTAFKRHLSECALGPDGALVSLSPAMGDFVLPEDPRQPLVMLAGGIGITPFYSMLRHLQYQAASGKAVPPVTLLYGNRTHALAAWRNELAQLCADLPHVRVLHVIAEDKDAPPPTRGQDAHAWRAGLIDAALIQQEVSDWQACRYYIVGPTAMVAAMQDCLDACGVPPEQVAIEFFAGY